jgi:type IX secretion system PorP/SprF family membrane protein
LGQSLTLWPIFKKPVATLKELQNTNQMKRKIHIVLVLIAASQLWSLRAMAQQPFNFTQYMTNGTPINAAYSALDDVANVNVVGRKQFIGINGAPQTFLFNGSVPIPSLTSTAGLLVLNDQSGPENVTEINAFFAKKIQLNKTLTLSTAINGGLRTYKVNNVDAADPAFYGSDVNRTQANLGFSVMLHSSDFYVGLSLPRLSLNTIGKTAQENKYFMNTYYLTGAYLKDLGSDFKIKPAALVTYSGSNLPMELNVSATLYAKDVVGVGVNYTTTNAFAGILSIFINNNINVGYSYQFSTAAYAIGGINNTTQELTLSYRFGATKAKLL